MFIDLPKFHCGVPSGLWCSYQLFYGHIASCQIKQSISSFYLGLSVTEMGANISSLPGPVVLTVSFNFISVKRLT